MGTLFGDVTLSFIYLLAFSREVCSQRKEAAPFGANSFLESKPQFWRAMSPREANKKSQKLFPLVKMTENMEVCPSTLNLILTTKSKIHPFSPVTNIWTFFPECTICPARSVPTISASLNTSYLEYNTVQVCSREDDFISCNMLHNSL